MQKEIKLEEIKNAITKVLSQSNINNDFVITTKNNITLAVAEKLIKQVEIEAKNRNMKVVIAVVDNGGNPVAIHCMDDSFLASYEIALNKAYTAVALKMPTKNLAKLANPNGGSLYGINTANTRIVIFGGGEPLVLGNEIIGAVAVSGGTAVQDTELGEFAKNKFMEIISWQSMKK